MDSNYDPRDSTHVRPQVHFRLKAGTYEAGIFFRELCTHVESCYDGMLFDAENDEVPGAIRLEWDVPAAVVDQAADYLRSLPFVIRVFPSYGRPIDAA